MFNWQQFDHIKQKNTPTSTTDRQTDKTRNMNININRTALERSVTNYWGGGLKSILQSSNPRPCLLIFMTEIIVRFNQKLPYLV